MGKLSVLSLTESIQILPDIPHHNTDQGLSQLRSPLRTDPAGPTRSTTLPAHLSPPPASRRPQISTDYQNGANRNSSYSLDDRSPRRSSLEKAPSHQLPIHSGPPNSRSSYSPSGSGPAPVSPYANQPESRRTYPSTVPNSRVRTPDPLPYPSGSALSTSLPPPPMPYRNGVNSHAPYKAERDYGSAGYGDAYYESSGNRTVPPYPATSTPPYNSIQPGYPLPPSGSAYFTTPPAHQYQNGYAHGPMQFEPEDMGNQVPRRRRGNLPRDTTDMLKQWFADHLAHPYPTEDEKQMLCRRTGLAMTQV